MSEQCHSEVGKKEKQSRSCGCSGNPQFDGMDATYKKILWLVIGINAGMFFIEFSSGYFAKSQGLKADALDFLGDSVTYGISLAVIGMSLKVRATAALIKGVSLLFMAVWVLGSTVYNSFYFSLPTAHIMGAVSVMALTANLTSVLLLMRYKDGDANVRSVWQCSRNDAIGNVAIMVAALGVWGMSSRWPDLIVAALLAGLFLRSAFLIISQARAEYKVSLGYPQE